MFANDNTPARTDTQVEAAIVALLLSMDPAPLVPTAYVVVSTDPKWGLVEKRFAPDELLPALAALGFAHIGVNANPRHRAELQGQPKFDGLAGPMYGGPGLVRYETSAAFRQLSA